MPCVPKGIGRPAEHSVFAFAVGISTKGVVLKPIRWRKGLKARAAGSTSDEALPFRFSLARFAFQDFGTAAVELSF